MTDLKLFFSIPQVQVAVHPILWTKSTSNADPVVRMTFARAARSVYDKKCNCYAWHRQTDYPTRRMQANHLTDQLTVRRGDSGGLPTGTALRLVQQ